MLAVVGEPLRFDVLALDHERYDVGLPTNRRVAITRVPIGGDGK
jgi:hypothetical protein